MCVFLDVFCVYLMFGCIKGVRVPLDGSHKCDFHMPVFPVLLDHLTARVCVFAFRLNLDDNSPNSTERFTAKLLQRP